MVFKGVIPISRPLNILVISPNLPYPPTNGGITRLYNLYNRLARKHYLIWVSPIYPANRMYVANAKKICQQVVGLPTWHPDYPQYGWQRLFFRFISRFEWERLFKFFFGYIEAPDLYWLRASTERKQVIRDILLSQKIDLIICEYEGNAEIVQIDIHIPKILVMHNVQEIIYRRFRNQYKTNWEDVFFYLPEILKIVQYEKQHYPQFNLITTVSNEDKKVVRRRCPDTPIEIIPNGVDISFYQPDTGQNTSKSLLYFGTFGHSPNVDAILYFCHEIWPKIRHRIPDIELIVVGEQPPNELRQFTGVEVVGLVPDMRPYLSKSCVVVVPLRLGSGTRLKILEAWAMGKAIVSTTIGAEGLKVEHEKNILIADHANDFADCVIRLIKDEDLRKLLGSNGRKLVCEDYDWDVICARLEQTIYSLVG